MTSVLALHGFTGGASTFAELAAHLPWSRVVAPVLAGHGPAPRRADSFEAEVRWLEAEARGLDGPVHLLGYSLGARLALALACRTPASFASVTCVGVELGIEDAAAAASRAAADDALAAMLEAEGLEVFARVWEAQPVFASQAALPESVRAPRQAQRRRHVGPELARALRVFSKGRMPSLRAALAELPIPAVFVVGARDAAFIPRAREAAESAPRGRLVEVPDAGHDVVLERPERIAEVLRELEEQTR